MEEEERLVFRIATPWFWWVIFEPGQRWTFWRLLNVLIFLVLSPLIIAILLISRLFSRPANRTPDEVARYLWNEAQGRSGFRDWDDVCIEIADPELDEIRREAASLPHPAREHRDHLMKLAERAKQLR
jgi:hypothetical protein